MNSQPSPNTLRRTPGFAVQLRGVGCGPTGSVTGGAPATDSPHSFRMERKVADGSFQVSFSFDNCNQPTSIRISFASPLVETSRIYERIFAAARELGCTTIESALK